MTQRLQWGLLGCGRSGQTQVDVHTSCGPEEILALEISKPSWSLRLRIPARDIVQRFADFLGPEGEASITIGAFDITPVEVHRDREFSDRFFIVVGREYSRTEFIIAGQKEISELSSALSQAAEDLK